MWGQAEVDMKINILFFKTSKDFTGKEKQRIKEIIREAANHAVRILNLKKQIINFTVYPFGKKFTFGFAQAKEWIHLSIPKKRINKNELESAVYHEMHHLARGFWGYTEKKISFLETLFSEGLAVIFEIEQVPKRIPPYSRYTKVFIKKWLPKLKKEKLFGVDFSHDEWFWGKNGKPKQLGYKIGTFLVRRIQKNYPKFKLEKLTKKSAKDLLKLSKVNL